MYTYYLYVLFVSLFSITSPLLYIHIISQQALGLLCIVVVSSKPQLIEVVNTVPGLQVISVSSRNMRQWRLQPNKAADILSDAEVQALLKSKRTGQPDDLVVLQEGFVHPAELVQAAGNQVDAVLLGEELVGRRGSLTEAVTYWMSG